MKCFYRRFTIFGDKEGEMHTYDMYARELLRLAKKNFFDTVSGYFMFPRTRKLHYCVIFQHVFLKTKVCRFLSGRVVQLHSSNKGTLAAPLGVSMALANFELIRKFNNLSIEIVEIILYFRIKLSHTESLI